MPRDRARIEKWLDDETARLLATVDEFRGRDPWESSTLPEWSLGQLLTHIARNADALCNLLWWARTGTETPMYASIEQRNDDINRGALRSIGMIVDDVAATAEEFHAALRSIPTAAWERPVRTAHGRSIPAAEIPWLRLREVVVHHVDLGARFEDFDGGVVGELLNDVIATLKGKPEWPAVAVEATDSVFVVAGHGPAVKGTSAELLGWLTGRPRGGDLVVASGSLPTLPSWL